MLVIADFCETTEICLPEEGMVICRLPGKDDVDQKWGVFSSPVKVYATHDVNNVCRLLAKIENETKNGFFVAGFISYEAAPAFDCSHMVKPMKNFPLLWFGVYDIPPVPFYCEEDIPFESAGLDGSPELAEDEYISSVKKIENYILDGDIYQANYTFRSSLNFSKVQPFKIFQSLFQSHPVPYAAYVNTGEHELVSLSPELFLEKNGQTVCSKPMKGTAP